VRRVSHQARKTGQGGKCRHCRFISPVKEYIGAMRNAINRFSTPIADYGPNDATNHVDAAFWHSP
jgi:hypothetical protein